MVNPVGGPNAVSDNQYDPRKATIADYSAAIQDFNKQDYKGSYANFKSVLKIDKVFAQQHPEVYYYLGLAAEYSGHTDAKGYLQTFCKLKTAKPEMIKSAKSQIDLMDGQAAMRARDYPAAIKSYESAIKLEPRLKSALSKTIMQLKGQIFIAKANAAYKKNDTEGMLKNYEAAAKADPAMAPRLAGTITQLQASKKWQSEQPEVNKVMKEAQDAAYTQADGTPGHPEKAITMLQGLLAKYPDVKKNMPSIYYTMSNYAWMDANTDQARSFFDKFEPHVSSIPVKGNEQFLAGVAYFKSQISGSLHDLTNWQTYAANWLGEHTPISSNFWNQNVLSGFAGIMPSGGYYKGGGKHPALWSYKKEGDTDAIGQVNDQIKDLRDSKAGKSPEERQNIDSQIDGLQKQKSRIENAGPDYKEDQTYAKDAAAKTERAKRGGFHMARTVRTGDDKNLSDDERAAAAAKGEVHGEGEGAAADPSGPGYWNLGTTLKNATATYKTFGEISQSKPMYLQKGGTGMAAHSMSLTGGVNALNVGARLFNMVYGGGTAAGAGGHYMYGAQARADLIDEGYDLNYAGGDTKIGGQDFDSGQGSGLATGGISEAAAIGTQADAQGGLSVGTHGAHIGTSGGVFAGAQASGQVSANLLGEGGFAMAQGWAGVGAKLNADLSISASRIHFDLGIGAALGIGGYIQISANINLSAMGRDLAAIYGGGTHHDFGGMVKRAGDLAADAASAGASMVGHMADEGSKMINAAQDKLSGVVDQDMFHAHNAKEWFTGAAAGVGEVAADAAEEVAEPALDVAKGLGTAVSTVAHVGDDLLHGDFKEAGADIGKGVVDVGEDVYSGIKSVWHGIKDFFHGW